MQRDGAPAGAAERLRLCENALQKCAQLQLFQPHLDISLGDGRHFRQIAHQPQQLIKALVETCCGAAERRVLHLLERDKKRRRDGEHIGQRRAHRLRDVQERVGRKPRALPVFIGDVEYGVGKLVPLRARADAAQTKPQALIRFFDEFSGILRSVDAAGGSGVVGVDNLALPYQNDRLGKGIEQFEFGFQCVLHVRFPLYPSCFYRIGIRIRRFHAG